MAGKDSNASKRKTTIFVPLDRDEKISQSMFQICVRYEQVNSFFARLQSLETMQNLKSGFFKENTKM